MNWILKLATDGHGCTRILGSLTGRGLGAVFGVAINLACPSIFWTRRYTFAQEPVFASASSLSSNSKPAVRGLWLRVYQR